MQREWLSLNTPRWARRNSSAAPSADEVMKSIWPFYGALIAALMLVTYIPGFSLWLPRLLFNYGG